MALQAANIRQTIIDVLESSVGNLQIDAGKFAFGVFEGQPTGAQQAKAVQSAVAAHRFDVVLSPLRNSDATNVAVNAVRRICELDITIPIWTHVKTTAQEDERKTILASIESDCEDAIQVLAHPSNLTESAAAGATNIVSGMMLGPGGQGAPQYRTVDADWKTQLVKSEIVGTLIVTVASLLLITSGSTETAFLWFHFGL